MFFYVFLELLYKTVQLVRVDHVHSDQICVFLTVCFCPAKAFMNAFLVINVSCHVPRAKGRVSDLLEACTPLFGMSLLAKRVLLPCAGSWPLDPWPSFLVTPVKPVKE